MQFNSNIGWDIFDVHTEVKYFVVAYGKPNLQCVPSLLSKPGNQY